MGSVGGPGGYPFGRIPILLSRYSVHASSTMVRTKSAPIFGNLAQALNANTKVEEVREACVRVHRGTPQLISGKATLEPMNSSGVDHVKYLNLVI
jgi:hypothetical protein